jgi:hypothetical protein
MRVASADDRRRDDRGPPPRRPGTGSPCLEAAELLETGDLGVRLAAEIDANRARRQIRRDRRHGRAAEQVCGDLRLAEALHQRLPAERSGARGAGEQGGKHQVLARVTRNERHLVHAARLPDAIEPAAALAQARRRPRQLEVHHDPAGVVKVQPF